MKQWKVLQTLKDKKSAEEIIKVLLQGRGLKTKKQVDEFLKPSRPKTLTPDFLGIAQNGLIKAAKRIEKAIDLKESVIIYGDYDADGICGTAILWEALNKLGAQCLPYIPKRLKEGYGLSIKGIRNLKDVKLIITVDNGITANKAVDYAKKKGIDVIITDHHLPSKKLPKASAIVHTTKLSGSGVAWVLARHLGNESGLELAAIGTIADMVSLIGANRSLVKFGLRKLNKTNRLGLLSLFKEVKLEKGRIEAWVISFIISPRLNASGRLADAMDALRLLCTKDPIRAEKLAKKLGDGNRRRQKLTEKTYLHAKDLILPPHPKLLFVASDSYHEGIIGLVAGNLVKEFYRPAMVISLGQDISKGSARSVEGFNLIKAIRKCEKFLIDCGGHPMAAGLTIKTTNLAKFKKCLTKIVEKELNEKKLTRVLKIDFELRLSDLTWKFYEILEKFTPFGIGNPKPVFCTRNLRIVEKRTVGNNGNHLKIKLDDPQTEKIEKVLAFDGIGFGLGSFAAEVKTGDLVDIAYTLEKNVWNNEETLQLKIRDIKIT